MKTLLETELLNAIVQAIYPFRKVKYIFVFKSVILSVKQVLCVRTKPSRRPATLRSLPAAAARGGENGPFGGKFQTL